ncbi:hypothetical protein [Pedobacter mendelii]|uniref:Por secretion system C-terminal sorting domain-containing protein n=1 Tax=Pedobacter mendelii TaxID=1908240 RepID=A0ABQ2BIP8_9SPHI|nr:hypothetical protein [Pedobacter mendelii]GGI24344.1 hypothetical protein GCM10008119_12190 [Pedobacter mendelii]
MKNLLKISLIAATMFTASATYANDDVYTLKVKSEDNKTIRFTIDEASDISLSITELNNQVLFEENIHATGASSKSYDLNALPDGEYMLNVESDSKLAAYKIVIANNKAVVSAPKITELLKPVFNQDKSMLTLSLDNADKGPIEVQILNEYNDEVYNETFTDKSKLVKKFNIAKTFGKELTFIVKGKNQEVFKTIAIR